MSKCELIKVNDVGYVYPENYKMQYSLNFYGCLPKLKSFNGLPSTQSKSIFNAWLWREKSK